MRNLLISLAAVLLGFNATAQTTQKLSATKLSEFGIIYRLPSTVIDITIEAERTVRHPGEFHRYAVKYFGTTERVVTADEESWTLKSVTLSAHGEAVDTLSYLAQFKAGTAATMIVNGQMIPLALNTDKTLTLPTTDLPVARAAQPTPLQSEAAREVMSEEMMQSQSLAKRAEIAANMLFSLRQSRTEIISGQAETMPPDGQALRLVLDRIDAQERALTAMFLGTEQTSTQVRSFTFTPDPNDDTTEFVIARLSQTDGIVDSDNLAGDPIALSLEVVSKGELPKNEKGEVKRFPKGGVAYRIPGKISCDVSFDGKRIASQSFEAAQYGVVFGIDPALFTDKKTPAFAIFNPITGSLAELGQASPANNQ